MAKWEVTTPPEMVEVAVEHYDKLLDEIAEVLYFHFCSNQGQWLGPIQKYSMNGELNRSVFANCNDADKNHWRTA